MKNVLVFAAPAAAGVLVHHGVLRHTLCAFVAFCLAASAVYLVNDALDAPADRLHPTKRNRPIAAGLVPVPLALWCSVGFGALALVVAGLGANAALVALLSCYFVLNLAYSSGLKRVPVIELGVVASGFILRAAAGGIASSIPLSEWFLVVVSFGALFLVTGKRSAELQRLGARAGEHRPVLAEYTPSFLHGTLVLSAGVTITGFCLWAFSHPHPPGRAGINLLVELTVVPVVLGVLHILLVLDRGDGGSPEELVYQDRVLQVLGAVFVALLAVGFYG